MPLSEPIAWGDLAAISTTLLAVAGLVGLLVRFGLVPYMRKELAPTREVAHQLTGTSPPGTDPTMREEVQELRRQIDEHSDRTADQLARAGIELRAVGRAFDGHLDWSQRELDLLWAAMNELRASGALTQDRPQHTHRKDGPHDDVPGTSSADDRGPMDGRT